MKKEIIIIEDLDTLVGENPEHDVAKILANLHIKPIVHGFYIKTPHPFSDSYIWDPKKKFPAIFKKKVSTITAKSYWGYYGLFKPSVAEVIDSIPNELIGKVNAFQITGEAKIVGNTHEFEVTLYKTFNLRSLVSIFSWKDTVRL